MDPDQLASGSTLFSIEIISGFKFILFLNESMHVYCLTIL